MTPKFEYQLSDSDITLTPSAKDQFHEIWKTIEDDTLEALRIYVAGGGCSGMTYGMTFTDQRTQYDLVKSEDTFNIYVDAIALNYIRGIEIDYETTPRGSTFVFSNVFASTGGTGMCGGCGGAGCG